MKRKLPLQAWNGWKEGPGEGGALLDKIPAVYRFQKAADLREYDGLRITADVEGNGPVRLTAALRPFSAGRPEFKEATEAEIFLPPGGECSVFLPFASFNYRQMADAHLRFIKSVGLALSEDYGGSVRIREASFSKSGILNVYADETSASGDGRTPLKYRICLENDSPAACLVTVVMSRYGKETVSLSYPRSVWVEPDGRREMEIEAELSERIPAGGFERLTLFFIPDGDGSRKQELILYAAKTARHPYLYHTEDGWERLKAEIAGDPDLQEQLREDYERQAMDWEAPAPADEREYVYPCASQEPFYRTLIAWKLTGKKRYLDKLLQYYAGFLDSEAGYSASCYSYFQFIESREELSEEDPKVRRAVNAGWVQEAEFMAKLAAGYDLLYSQPSFTPEMHVKMRRCLREYMEFTSWRLTDGDGNNFQIAEASAAFFCACVLQDYEKAGRFLDGKNGLSDLAASVFGDDGSYFEGASGYMRLAAELIFAACNAAENFGMNLKDRIVPAAFDRPVIHSPWALRQETASDGKPFLGMSFERFDVPRNPVRRIRDYFTCLLNLLTPDGILFSANDSNEQNLIPVMEMAYYLYREPLFLKVADLADKKHLLYGKHMTREKKEKPGVRSILNRGNGFAVLRERLRGPGGEEFTQTVLKFGQHGGYHGHYDRLSLLSYIKNGQTFHNLEYAWYGYDSFLFKMWVQTSTAHNMVVVDGKMQEPSHCSILYYKEGGEFSAVCAQTVSRWSDPPYGGQTPYPLLFPEEKCKKEGRYILPPAERRKQGDIGEYTEPILQRRLVVLYEGCVFVWDYEEAEKEHIYDCFYHPMGSMTAAGNLRRNGWKARYDENPYGSGQFITNCFWYEGTGTVRLSFNNQNARVNPNDVMDFVTDTELYRIHPQNGDLSVGRYPERKDTFSQNELTETPNEEMLRRSGKKSICFRIRGKSAKFVTALWAGAGAGRIAEIVGESYECIRIIRADHREVRLRAIGMDSRNGDGVRVSLEPANRLGGETEWSK